nr:MAG TPA: hypothetical protein [Caudoviricetes sp.]
MKGERFVHPFTTEHHAPDHQGRGRCSMWLW